MIDLYIQKIPPAPKALQKTIHYLNIGELTKASSVAKEDLALSSYLKSIVNKPIYGFRNNVSDIPQIFGILGVSGAKQSVYNYLLTLLSPDKWSLFKLNSNSFHELQAQLSVKWKIILKHLNIIDKDIESAITLLPASIIVCDALFGEKIEDVNLLRSVNNLDFNTILMRLCKFDLFDICEEISIKWEMPENISKIIQASSGKKESSEDSINILGKWMHLLLFYELSQPIFVKAELNDFIDFNIEYVSDIYEEFAQLMDIK